IIFGEDLYGLRIGSAICGTLSILFSYLVFKKLFSVRVAALAAFFAAISLFGIHFGRQGQNVIQAPFAQMLLFYFLFRGIETRRAIDFWLAGLAAGLAMEVYFGSRIALGFVGAYLLIKVFSERGFLRRNWVGFVTMAIGAIVFLAPTVP